MRKAFKYIITGFLFVLFDIHIIFDILPDPIGYILIFVGARKLEVIESSTHFTSAMASILLVLAIPNIFINPQLFQQQPPEWWGIYSTTMGLIDLILVYFLFKLIRQILQLIQSAELIIKTEKTYKGYMFVMIIILFIQPFLINMTTHLATGIMIFSGLAGIITQITFLFFLRTIQKQFPHGNTGIGDLIHLKA
jgi:hypothetical protein